MRIVIAGAGEVGTHLAKLLSREDMEISLLDAKAERLGDLDADYDLLYEETENLFKRVKVSKELCELRNMINVGYLITRMAIERKESRGLHYTIDYPVHAYDKK